MKAKISSRQSASKSTEAMVAVAHRAADAGVDFVLFRAADNHFPDLLRPVTPRARDWLEARLEHTSWVPQPTWFGGSLIISSAGRVERELDAIRVGGLSVQEETY
jgi:hypothetical protein